MVNWVENIDTHGGSNKSWNYVAMSADGTKQTAVVYGGKIYTSSDSGGNLGRKH